MVIDQVNMMTPLSNEPVDQLRLKVYIAEDSAEIRKRLKEMLEENPYLSIVGESGDADRALADLHEIQPDAIILDSRLPGGGGMRILVESKKRYPDMLAIVFTAFPYPQHRKAFLAAGADYFLDKTADQQKLTHLLASLARIFIVNRNNAARGKHR
jgi:DNA-binding NarL/FixJ family response regulator